MGARGICHALQCLERAARHGALCETHWRRLPADFRAYVARGGADAAQGNGSGAFHSAVILAVRWLAVDDGLLPGPPPRAPPADG